MMSAETVVVNPLLAAIKKEEERKKTKEAERMRRRQLRAERRALRARAGSAGRTSKRNSSQLPLPIPSYEELSKNLPRTCSSPDEALGKTKLAVPSVGRSSLHHTPPRKRLAEATKNPENGPVAGPKEPKGRGITAASRKAGAPTENGELGSGGTSEGRGSFENRRSSTSSYDTSEEEEPEESKRRLSINTNERWNRLREETGFHYLDTKDLDILEKWLQDMRLPADEYMKLFLAQGFDNLQTIALLKDEDIASIGITKIGHRKKIMFWAQNHRPANYDELMHTNFDLEDDGDLAAMHLFTSWVDYPTSSPRSPLSATPASPNSPKGASPFSTPLNSPTAATTPNGNVNTKPKTKTK